MSLNTKRALIVVVIALIAFQLFNNPVGLAHGVTGAWNFGMLFMSKLSAFVEAL